MNNYLLGAIILASLAAGTYVEHNRLTSIYEAQIARLAQEQAEEIASYTASLLAGAQATDMAISAWHNQVKQSEAKTDAIKTKLSALQRRACLSADAVRLLNGANSMPAPAERVAGATTSTPADPAGYASSHAVSIWAADVQRQYDACRAQVDALRAWAATAYP